MAGVARPQQNPAGNNETDETSKTLAQAMADLTAEVTRLMATVVTPENQESINAELAKLHEAMAKAQRDVEAEAARVETQQAMIAAETERLNTEGWRLERKHCASYAIHQRRHHGHIPTDLHPTPLFDTPRTPGAESNYMSESLMFEVVKIKSPYHALFGRPAYARFMARPCYVYLKIKMLGPKGPIKISGDTKIAQECEEGNTSYDETACAAEELKFHQANVDAADMTLLKKPTIDSEPPLKFKPTDDTKVIDFTPGNSTKQFTIGTGLDPK
ncbi:hypothetical protein ZWY2020_052365 [Hordeum vulgare]|nr:hypothetical protein ZWY2020_052365 [Hordeum vulgare]